ncbi:DUF4279 domain-containing protein [Paenibacillus sp. GCM10027629]|uniref:DUF4279 domain-containing protein n=1 Tax=Paenibacillus sp. GCM10027629 TaxID=3273414 RepID=UPI0036D3F5BD
MSFEDITTSLKLQPTTIKRKGEPLTSDQVINDDYWSYKVKFGDGQMDTALESFLNSLKPSNEFIRSIANNHETYIFFSLRSGLGQMGFELKPDVLKALSDMEIKFEVHVLSFGEVKNT